jgi:hypothetical protein
VLQHEAASYAEENAPANALSEQIVRLRLALDANAQRLADTCDKLQATRQVIASGRSRRQRLHDSAYARLQAQLETMPVIEQAKGILIAQTGCSPDAAFDMLRQASQRSNIRVSDLAAAIVQRSANGRPAGRVLLGLPTPADFARAEERRAGMRPGDTRQARTAAARSWVS